VLRLRAAVERRRGINELDAEFEPVSPLDVPAFLRRQTEG
jgi:hypothetical protein